jgi:hypothetical protein
MWSLSLHDGEGRKINIIKDFENSIKILKHIKDSQLSLMLFGWEVTPLNNVKNVNANYMLLL